MSIRDIFSSRAGTRNDYSGTEFSRLSSEHTLKLLMRGTGKSSVILAPMKSLSLEDFTFPFQNTSKIRDALKLQVMPFTAGGEMEIFPVILSKTGRSAGGIVWYVSPGELEIPSGKSAKIWPAPLPLISGLEDDGGNGVTLWKDEECISSLLWQSNRPVLYRWNRQPSSEAQIFSWYDSYCSSRGLERGGDFTFDACDSEYDIQGLASESVRICPWINDVNLSRSALEGARDLERTVKILGRVSLWLLFAGAIMLGAEAADYFRIKSEADEITSRSAEYYRKTFDPSRTGRISNPVNLARDKIASLSGKGEYVHSVEEVLADLGEIFGSMRGDGITIDILRYNTEGIDCTGTAPDMTTVLNFRRSWEDKASLVQVDNTQFVSGIGYRFDLRIRW